MDLAGMKRRELQELCKRHGLPAGGTNANLVARLDAALSEAADAAAEVAGRVPARKGCLKQTGGDAADAKKVTFAAEEGKASIWSPPVLPKKRGKSAQASVDSAAEVGISAERSADGRVTRSRRNSVVAAKAEEVGEAVAVDRKRKRNNQENDEGVAVSLQVGVSARVTRRSSLAGAAFALPPAVKKKRGRGKAAGGSNKLVAEVQDSEPNAQKSAQVEVSARITRSRTTALVITSPTVVENKGRRKTGDAQTNVEQPTVSDLLANINVPVIRSLRNRTVQVNNTTLDETHTARQLENKLQPSGPPTRRRQQVSSSVEGKSQEQIAAPNKAPLLRRSGRSYSEDAEKQPAVEEPVRRSTRNSVVLANDLIEQKNPEVHVRRSMRKSIVPVKDIKGIGEEIQNASSKDAAKQPATKRPVRGSRRKSVVSELHEKEKDLIAEKNIEAHEGKTMWKPVMPVKDIKAVGEGIKSAKGKIVEKQFAVKQPTRRSSRKSVLPDMLENNNGLLATEKNAKANDRRSTRKSVLPNMLNEENQDRNKMSRSGNSHSGKCQDDEREQEAKEPFRRSRRSVATVPLEEQNDGFHEEKVSKIPMRRSTRKSVALNAVEKVSMDDNEVGEEGLKLRKHRRSLLEISSSANDSWMYQNAQIPNEKDNTGGTQQTSNCTASKGRSSKRRRTTATEDVMSVKVANDDIVIMEAIKDTHSATHEYNESSSKVQEICQVNATKEEFSLGSLIVTVALTDEICTPQSVPVVIPGPESGDNANECSDKSKQPQEHYDTQAVDCHLSETRSGKLDQSTCIAGLVPRNCVIEEDKALLSEDGLSINFTLGDREEQSPSSREGRVGLEANASEPREKNLVNVMYTGLRAKSPQHDIDIITEETDNDVLPMAFSIEERGEKYAVSPVAVEKSVGWEASARESAGKPLTGIFSNDLHTKILEHDCDVLTNENGEASGAALPTSESVTNPETQCNAIAESIRAADLGKCPGRASRGKPYSRSLHLEGVADDSILTVLNDDEGCSSDGRPSSLGLELLFAEACRERYYKNVEDEDEQPTGCDADKNPDVHQGVAGEENTAVEINGGNKHKPSTPITPCFSFMKDVTEEEVLAQEKCNDQHIPSKTNLKMKLNDELVGPGCTTTEKNERFVAENLDQQAIMQVQLGDVQEGDLEKLSLCSATPDSKHECGLPEENTATEIDGGNKPRAPVAHDIFVGSSCLENEDVQPAGCGADKKLDVYQSVAGDAVLLIDFTVGDHEEQSPVSGEGKVGLEANTIESGEKNLAIGIVAEETGKDVMPMAFTIEGHREIDGENGENEPSEDDDVNPTRCNTDTKFDVDQGVAEENTAVEIDGGNKPSTPVTPVTNLSPTEEEALAQEKCNDQHVPAKTDLKLKLNDELAGPCMESGCSIIEKNGMLVSANLYQEGDFKKPSLCSATPEWKHDCGLPEETISPSKNMESLPSAEQSPFGLESLFSQESIDESVGHGALGSATAHTENGFDYSEDSHVKSALKNAHVSEPFSHHDTKGGISRNVDCMHTSQQDNGMEDAIENPSMSLSTPGYKHDGALSEEAVHSMKDYAGTCSSNPRKVSDICAMSEAAPIEVLETGIAVEMSSLLEGHLNPELDGDEVEKHNLNCENDNSRILGTGSVMSKTAPLPKDVMPMAFTIEGHREIDGEIGENKPSDDDNVQPTRCDTDKKFDVDQGVTEENTYVEIDGGNKPSTLVTPVTNISPAEEEVLAQEKCNHQHVPAKTDLKLKLNDELAGPCMESDCSIIEKNEMLVSDNLDKEGDFKKPPLCSATPECKHECSLSVEAVSSSNNMGPLPSAEQSPFGLESLFSQENVDESVGHGALASATAHTENGFDDSKYCHVKSALESAHVSKPFSHHDTKGGISKNVDCMQTSQQDNGMEGIDEMEGLPEANPDEKWVLSAFSLDAKHIKEVINSEMACVGEGSKELLHSKDLKASSEKTYVNGTDGNAYGISDIVLSSAVHAPADDNYEICLGSSTDVLCQVHNDRCSDGTDRFASKPWSNDKERSNLKDGQLNSKLEGAKVVESGLYFNKDIGNISDNVSVGERTGSGLSKYSSVGYRQEISDGFSMEASLDGFSTCGEPNVCGVDAIENPSVSIASPGCNHEGALSEEAMSTIKNYVGTCSSNPRKIVMELQSLFSKENIKESDPHESLAFPSVENPADESIIVEQQVKAPHGSNMSQLGSTDLLDEPIGCSNTEVLGQCHHHKDQSNEDRVEQVVSEPCTNDIVEAAAAAAKYIESRVVLLPSEERSNLNDGELNRKLESPNIMESGLNCDKDVCNTLDNGPFFAAVGKRTLFGSALLEDYPKDHYPQRELLDGFSGDSSLQGSVSGSGPYQQYVNESTSMQVTDNIKTLNQYHEEYSQNNEDHTTPAIPASSVPEAVEIEQTEIEIGLVPAAEASVLLPDKQLDNKLGNEEHSYDKDFSTLSCTGFQNRVASNLHKDDSMDQSSEDNHLKDLPTPRSPEQSSDFLNNNDAGSVGLQSSRGRGIDELRAKLQNFKVSSTVRGSYIAMSAPRPKPGASMSQSAIALLRNIENTTAGKAGHPVKPNTDAKDSSRRALQPISGRPRQQ